jgi:hypothetical protein
VVHLTGEVQLSRLGNWSGVINGVQHAYVEQFLFLPLSRVWQWLPSTLRVKILKPYLSPATLSCLFCPSHTCLLAVP